MAKDDVVSKLFDEAYALAETYENYLTRRKAVRESLRNLATAGVLTDEQIAEVDELFPERTRKAADEPEPEPVAS